MSPSADIVRCLPDLPHLKYLVVVLDHTATPAYQLKLVRYAIQLNLRVLCLMTQQSTLRYCQPISNWNHRLETINEHLDPRLKNSYLSYKRRMLQVMVLHRTQLRFNYFRESIIEAAGSSFEIWYFYCWHLPYCCPTRRFLELLLWYNKYPATHAPEALHVRLLPDSQ